MRFREMTFPVFLFLPGSRGEKVTDPKRSVMENVFDDEGI